MQPLLGLLLTRNAEALSSVVLPENRIVGVIPAAFAVAGLVIAGDWAQQDGWVSVGALASVLISLSMFAFGLRVVTLGVELKGNHWKVRNVFKTHMLDRSSVKRFVLTESSRLRKPMVAIELDPQGSLRVAALSPASIPSQRQQARLQTKLEALNRACQLPNSETT